MKLIRRKPDFLRLVPAGLGILLAVVWLGGVLAPAQEGNPAPPETPAAPAAPQPDAQGLARPDEVPLAEELPGNNDMSPPEDFASDDEQVPTNGAPGLTTNAPGGETRISGREARARRFRRPAANPAGGLGGANGSGSGDSVSGTNGGTVSLDYSAFKIVASRNIFDPNRYPRSRPGPKQPPREYLTLVGTMSYEKGAFAFFSGSSAKALKVTDSIAGFKVKNITPDAVKLASGTNEVELRVGMQLRRDEGGPWVPSRGSVSYAAAATPATASSTDAGASSAESDIIKRLMKRREQE